MNKVVIALVLIAVVAGGIYAFRGGSEMVLGQGVPEGAEIVRIADIQDESWNGREITLEGEMIQKCPTTGCWFYLKDDSGDIRVSTSAAGFTILDVPMYKTVTVHGRVLGKGNNFEIAASGVKM